ncbi:MAG: TolC family protein, partial [Phycisphaeraceae bacterium]|nr:TolC family protein [Phycisphaeraceae bacterium]
MHGPRSAHIPFLLIVAAALAGCSTGASPFDDDPVFADWPEDRKLNDLRRRLAPQLRPRAETGSPPALFQSAQDPEPYIRKVLRDNPALRSARRRIERLAARVPQAEGLDDPMLQVAPVGRMAETAAGEVGWMSSISQRLPHPDKLRGRSRVAAQKMAVAVAEWHRQRLSVIAETRRAYWSLYYIARAIEVNRTNQDLLEQFHQIASAQLRAGMADQQDVLRASVELNHLKNERTVLDQRRTSTVAMLNMLMDQPADTPLPSPKPIKLQALGLEVQQLLDRAARHNPEIRKAEARLAAFRERVELARLNRTPDLTVSANYV